MSNSQTHSSLVSLELDMDEIPATSPVGTGIIHPNLKQMSHSSNVTLHRCNRKYELYKLLPSINGVSETDDRHTSFGSAVGVGIADLLTNNSINSAIFAALTTWKKLLDDDDGERDRKTFWHAIYALNRFQGYQRSILGNYSLAVLNGRPATELGFTIDCGDGFYYRGFIDAVLVDNRSNELIVYENKTTKFRNIHEAVYKNSGQSLGYGLILDIVSQSMGMTLGSSFKVIYGVYKSLEMDWEFMPFMKSHTQRATWIKSLLIDKQLIAERAIDNYFPMHGESCYDFFRPCSFFGICEVSNEKMFPKGAAIKKEKKEKYDYQFDIVSIIESQLKKHEMEGV
jgi:hypothetical protein